jgi:hypothetical protein
VQPVMFKLCCHWHRDGLLFLLIGDARGPPTRSLGMPHCQWHCGTGPGFDSARGPRGAEGAPGHWHGALPVQKANCLSESTSELERSCQCQPECTSEY